MDAIPNPHKTDVLLGWQKLLEVNSDSASQARSVCADGSRCVYVARGPVVYCRSGWVNSGFTKLRLWEQVDFDTCARIIN